MSLALQRKVHKVLDSRVRFERPEVIQAIEGLSSLQHALPPSASSSASASPADPTLPSSQYLHRHFRTLLDSRHLSLHHSLLASFAPVRSELDALTASLDETASVATELMEALRTIKARSTHVFESAAKLEAEKQGVVEKQQLVHTFLQRFQLDAKDVAVLQRAKEVEAQAAAAMEAQHANGAAAAADGTVEVGAGITDDFFSVLEKIERMKGDIERMLMGGGGADGSTTPRSPSSSSSGFVGLGAGSSSRISFDLLDSLSRQLEDSYELLYRYLSCTLSSGSLIKVSDVTPKLVRSFLVLSKGVPVFYEHAVGELVSLRRGVLLERFLKALSRGTASARPIELAAHDPVRYTSDMLAWVHQALANEKEFLVALFPPEVREGEGTHGQQQLQQQQQMSIGGVGQPTQVHAYQRYLSTIFEAISRPLKMRIEQSFLSTAGGGASSSSSASASSSSSAPVPPSSSPSVVVSTSQVETVFKILNIIKFYSVIIQPILPSTGEEATATTLTHTNQGQTETITTSPSSPADAPSLDLVSTLSQLALDARRTFFLLLHSAGSRLLHQMGDLSSGGLPADLSPGPLVSEWVAQLQAILRIYNSALVDQSEKEKELEEIVGEIMKPLLQAMGVEEGRQGGGVTSPSPSSSPSPPPPSSDHLIYRLNVLQSVLDVCAHFPQLIRARLARFSELITIQSQTLIQVQVHNVLEKVGLKEGCSKAKKWKAGSKETPLLGAGGAIESQTLLAGIKSFYSSLQSVGAFLVPQCDRVLHSPLRRQIRSEIGKGISTHYATLYAAVWDQKAGAEAQQVQAAMIHTPQHVDLMLDVQGAAQAQGQGQGQAAAGRTINRAVYSMTPPLAADSSSSSSSTASPNSSRHNYSHSTIS